MTTITQASRHRSGQPDFTEVWASRLRRLATALWRDPIIVIGLLVVVGLVSGLNMFSGPSLYRMDDEGTYVAQAWAVGFLHTLAHYVYWYDHPPGGWLLMAAYAKLTFAFERHDSAVAVGREFMLVCKLVSVALMYVLARRIQLNRFFAMAAVLLFGLCPLAVYYQRITYLDNIAVMWVLAAFVLAKSPRSHLGATIGSALCFGMAVLTKETMLVILPALIWQLWQGSHPRTWRMSKWLWAVMFVICGLCYLLMAAIKHELFPGPGHVDLWYAIKWQLASRSGSGSIFDPSTAAGAVFREWTTFDPWLLGAGVALLIPAFFKRELRPVACALAILLAVMVRPGGYLPGMYVIGLFPFAALVAAGSIGAVWDTGWFDRFMRLRHQIPRTGYSYAQVLVQVPALLVVLLFAGLVMVPQWAPSLKALMTEDHNQSSVQTLAWIETNVPTHKDVDKPVRILVSDTMWVDLKVRGYSPDWYYKVDLDPAVKKNYPEGWRSVDYLVMTHEMIETANPETPTMLGGRDNGTVVATFGSGVDEIRIYRVDPNPSALPLTSRR